MIDLNTTKAKRGVFSDGLQAVLDGQMQHKRTLQPARHYLGASAVGGECERAIQFDYAGAPRERDFKTATLRKFEFGHMTEEWCRQEFQDAGFNITQQDERTRQPIGFSQLDGEFKGHIDGKIVSGPDVKGLTFPALWEHKGVGSKTYRSLEKDGLKKSKPAYYAQVNIYMGYCSLHKNPAVFSVTNLDSGEQMHLSIDFDAENAQSMTDRAVRIVGATKAGELLPRPFASADHFICRTMCDFPERCWKLPK